MAAPVRAGATFEADVSQTLFELDGQLLPLVKFDATADGQRFVFVAPTADQISLPIAIVTNWQQALVE